MKFISVCLALLCSSASGLILTKKLKLLKKKLLGHEETTTTPAPTTAAPPTVKCDVIWEEKVTPLCKTVHNKVCKPEVIEKCSKVWEEKCWDEPVKRCKDVKQCSNSTQSVCKTEYTVTCDNEHKSHHKRSAHDADGVHDHEEDDEDLSLLAKREVGPINKREAGDPETNERVKRSIIPLAVGLKKKIAKKFKKEFKKGEETTTTPAPTVAPVEELCHHHPHTTCWDEPVEKCVNVPECWDEPEKKCKKVPKEVCEEEEIEKCWDEPTEHCEYLKVKVARKHCRKPTEAPKW